MSPSHSKKAVEVCAYSLESSRNAQIAGADRIELCASPYEGGTTPSMGLVRQVRAQVRIGLHVMIRPRGGDFCYDAAEWAVMEAEVAALRESGVDGLVMGVLTPDGRVDVRRTRQFVAWAHPLPVTFHRAFDVTRDLDEALDALLETGCRRILTSGGTPTAPTGLRALARCAERAAGRIEIMAGSGVSAQAAAALLATGVDALHLSARSRRESAMTFRKEGIPMGGLAEVPEYGVEYADVDKIRAVVAEVRRCESERRIG